MKDKPQWASFPRTRESSVAEECGMKDEKQSAAGARGSERVVAFHLENK